MVRGQRGGEVLGDSRHQLVSLNRGGDRIFVPTGLFDNFISGVRVKTSFAVRVNLSAVNVACTPSMASRVRQAAQHSTPRVKSGEPGTGSESLQLADDLVAFRKKLLRHWSGQKHVILTSFVASNPDQQNGGESAAADQGL